MQTEALHKPADCIVRILGCYDRQIVVMMQFFSGTAWFQQRDSTPGDRFRRVEPVNRPWRQTAKYIRKERIVRAGQNDNVGAAAILLNKARGNLVHNQRLIDLLATNMRFRYRRKLIGTDETNMALGRERLNEITRISTPDSTGVASTETSPDDVLSAAGLIAGTVPTNGTEG